MDEEDFPNFRDIAHVNIAADPARPSRGGTQRLALLYDRRDKEVLRDGRIRLIAPFSSFYKIPLEFGYLSAIIVSNLTTIFRGIWYLRPRCGWTEIYFSAREVAVANG